MVRKGCCPLVPLPSENGKVCVGGLTSDTSRGRVGYICPNCQAPAGRTVVTGLWNTRMLPRGLVIMEGWTCLRGKFLPNSPELGTGCRSQPCPAAWSHPSQYRMDLFVAKGSCSYHGSDAVGRCGADGVMVGIGGCIDSTITREEQGGGGCRRGTAEAGCS